MTVTTVHVMTADLGNALAAVAPHVGKAKGAPEFARVRITTGEINCAVTAFDRWTAGLAIVSTEELDGEHGVVAEILPEDAAKIAGIFKVAGGVDELDCQLRIEISDEHVRVTDVSGLIEGRSLRVPRLATEDALSLVPRVIQQAHLGQLRLLQDITDLTVSGDHLARWRAAAQAYGMPVQIDPRSTGRDKLPRLVVRCGESFLGIMVPQSATDDRKVKAKQFAEDWAERLPDIVAAAPEYTELQLLPRAVRLVVATQHGSAAMLQRRLVVGFNRAARLLDEMHKRGIVGPPTPDNSPRSVNVPAERLTEVLDKIEAEQVAAE